MTESEVQEDARLADSLGILGKIDSKLYRVETIVVVAALILMSVMVFTDVMYQFSVALSQYFDAGDSRGYTLTIVLSLFVGAMGFAATAPIDDNSTPVGKRIGVGVLAVLAFAIFAYSLLKVESSTVYRVLLVLGSIPVILNFKKRQEPGRLGTFAAAAVLAFIVMTNLPTGYSWAQSYSLLLLLWVGFLGASMAARDRRHLRVDLTRKLLSAKKLPWFNAMSYLAAASFSSVIFYLSYEYMFGFDSSYLKPIWEAPTWLPAGMQEELTSGFPLAEDASVVRRAMQVFFAPSEPGEVPDWLKVLAIPVSFFLITVRFLGHTIAFTRMGLKGQEFSEDMGAH